LILAFCGICLLAGHIYKTHRAASALIIYLHHLGHISIYKNGAVENLAKDLERYQITEAEVAEVNQILTQQGDAIEMSGGFLSGGGLLSSGNRSIPIFFQGISPDLDEYVRNRPEIKKWLPGIVKSYSEGNLKRSLGQNKDSISIAKGVGELMDLFLPIEEIPAEQRDLSVAGRDINGYLNAVNATVALKHGTGMPFLDDVSVIGSLEKAQELFGTKGVGHLVIYLKDIGNIKEIVSKLSLAFKEKNLDLEPIPFKDKRIGLFYSGSMGFLFMIGSISALLLLSASGLIIVNSMTIGVLERSKEIGTLRSIGFSPGKVVRLFVKEAFWLSLFSSVLGILLAETICTIINSLELFYETPGTDFPISLYLWVPAEFYAILVVIFVLTSVALTYWIVGRKLREKIAVLLLESGTTL
jgi:putative ABC transport system permease protein